MTEQIIKTCKTHGELTQDKCIKSGASKKGTQLYRCKLCMQEMHRTHYLKNKEKLLQRSSEYRAANPEKVKESKQKHAKKLWQSNKDNPQFREQHRANARKWRQDNATAERARDRRYSKRVVTELADPYIRDKLKRGTTLKNEDLPQELIELKRTVMLTKRLIRLKTHEARND